MKTRENVNLISFFSCFFISICFLGILWNSKIVEAKAYEINHMKVVRDWGEFKVTNGKEIKLPIYWVVEFSASMTSPQGFHIPGPLSCALNCRRTNS